MTVNCNFQEIWNENEHRQSPTNILEPVFEDTLPVLPSAPPEPADNVFGPDFDDATAPAESEEENPNNSHEENPEDNEDHVTNEEEEIIEILKSSQNSQSSQNHHSPAKSRNSLFRNQNVSSEITM